MTIEFVCPHCDKLLRTADDKAGARAACPHCQGPIEIPAAEELEEVKDDPLGDFFNSAPPRPPAARALPATIPCSDCGQSISSRAASCPYCGAKSDGPPPPEPVRLKAHRGGLILTLAVCGWVTLLCVPLSFSAAMLGTHDLKEMHAGRMDPSGEMMTHVGQILGFIQLIGFGIVVVIGLVSALFK